ncbi:TolC family protein [Telmatobacter bradus]|uniref:TolC family protein n=1 Tax=Telmatobacter bradus TaxID=474953 RepID=UPI003B429ADB
MLSAPPEWAQSAARALQLPLSGTAQSGASVGISAQPSMNSSVNTLNVQVTVQGAYAGSMQDANPSDGVVRLSLAEAVQHGLQHNLGRMGADAGAQQAQAQWRSARSALLPTISASFSENAAKEDLASEGFTSALFDGFQLPSTVGPFHYYDLHGSLQQSVLDLTALYNNRSARQSANGAILNAQQAREEVVLAVSGSYLQLLATAKLIEEQQMEVAYAEASYKQARAQADAGNQAPLEANRSLVELQTEQQRLRSQKGDLQKQKYALARLIGIQLGVHLELTDQLQALSNSPAPVDEVVRRAWAQRLDLRSAEAGLRAAEEARKAAQAEHLPTVSVSGQYGLQGTNPNQGNGIFQASAAVNLPIFNGGRIRADVTQADATLNERRAELSSKRGAVELDVRNAMIDLEVAGEQVQTAESNRQLALANLQQSQDRFAVGVADTVEVVNAQQSLAAADHDYVSSLLAQNLATLTLAHATGETEKNLSAIEKGAGK